MCLHRCSKKVLLKILKRFVGPEKYAGPAKRFMLHFDSATGHLANLTAVFLFSKFHNFFLGRSKMKLGTEGVEIGHGKAV